MGKCILAGHPPVGGQIGYGTYAGDNAGIRFINLGITPKWVLVLARGTRLFSNDGRFWCGGLAVTGKDATAPNVQPTVKIADGGFNVYNDPSGGSSEVDGTPNTNSSAFSYNYIYGT